MDIVTLDFETYYDKNYSLSKMTYDEYIHDSRFEVVGVSVCINNGEPKWFSGNMQHTKTALQRLNLQDSAVVMHNAMFDASILSFTFGIRPKIIFDTLSMARAIHGSVVGGSLAKLATHYGLGVKGTEVQSALGLRRCDFTPEQLSMYGEYCKNDVKLTYDLFKKMQPLFSLDELKLIDMAIRMYTEPKFMCDQGYLAQHIEAVKRKKAEFLANTGLTALDLRSNQKFAELLRQQGVEPPVKLNSKGIETYALAKTDEGLQLLLEHENETVRLLAEARLGVKSSLEETRAFGIMEAGGRNHGYIPIGIQYYGAASGRFSATQKLQFQNLPNKSDLKRGIIAPSGHSIVGSDLSNIELRVGLWFAGQQDKLDILQNGLDLYKDFATVVFDVPYNGVTKDQRFISKTSTLSLIYGTGHARLRAAIKSGSGVDIGEDEAKRIVKTYREEHPKIVELWDECGKALPAIIKDEYLAIGRNDICEVVGGTGIRLPSGLYMKYPNLRRIKNDEGRLEWVYDKRQKESDRIYPAKVMQNLTQALARCVLGEAMVRIHKVYPIALTVHDAVYCVVPDEEAQTALDLINAELTKPPMWLSNIVLAAEGHIGKSLKEV